MSYPGDEPYEFFLRDELFDQEEGLRRDSEFLGLLDDLFDYDMARNMDEGAADLWDRLHDYLWEHYDIELDYYWDWEEWRAEYNAA